MITEAEIKKFRNLRKEYEKIVTSKVLENCNKIVQIGAFTAELKEDGNVALSRAKYPSQFTEETALKILNMGWESNGNKKPILEIFNVKDWYLNKIEALNAILNFTKRHG